MLGWPLGCIRHRLLKLFVCVMNTFTKTSILAIALVAAIGCGGGGAGGSAVTPAAPKVGFYVTSAQGPYSHVWVNVKQANLVGPAGSIPLFKSSTGKAIDLASLSAGGQKLFAPLGVASVPSSKYNKVQIVVDSTATVINQGASQGSQASFTGSTGTTKTISFPSTFTGAGNLVAKFDLSKWTLAAGQVTATAQEDDGSQVGSTTQEPQDFGGSVANLSGTPPTLAFDITSDGTTIHVVTSASTVIANSDGTANPVLANNSRIHVVGTIDTTTNALDATSIKIEIGNTQSSNDVRGTVASTNSAGNSLVLTVTNCDGALPTSTTLNVNLTTTTTYLDGNGLSVTEAQFFTAAATGTRIDAQGTYDQPSNTITATTVSIHQDGQGDGQQRVQLQGPVASVDVANSAFTITASEFENVLLTKGSTVNVVTNSSTTFNGVTMATLATGATVDVRGTYSGTTLTATEVSASGGGGKFHRIR